MNNADDLAKEDTALDLLEEEDQRLQELFALLDQNRGTEVEERSVYGDTAKQIIRHIANREAALHDVVEGMSELTGLNDIVDRMDLNTEDRRQLISQAEGMSRGVQGINLNTGQDFHSVVAELANLLSQRSNGSCLMPFQLFATPQILHLGPRYSQVQATLRSTRQPTWAPMALVGTSEPRFCPG